MHIIILLAMIYCHIFDDFALQGIMKNMKCKSWWQENAADKKYQYDYLIVLALHAFSWTFSTLVPLVVYMLIANISIDYTLLIAFIINWIIHFIVDNEKANKLRINLIIDQTIHIVQIIVTWLIFI